MAHSYRSDMHGINKGKSREVLGTMLSTQMCHSNVLASADTNQKDIASFSASVCVHA